MVQETKYAAELEVATDVAVKAAEAVMRHYGKVNASEKQDASPVTAADHAANHVIISMLREHFPGDAILSEESRDSADRLAAQRVWIIDPLDGTKEFLAQNGEFAVMIGLAEHGKPVVGVMSLPASGILLIASQGGGAWMVDQGIKTQLRCQKMNPDALRLVGSRSHADPQLAHIQEILGITDVEPCGSVGVKCSRIALGQRDVYIHPVPYLKEWDTCAPEVMMREAGGWVSDGWGAPLEYNKADPCQPNGIVVCGGGDARAVVDAVRQVLTPLKA